MTDLLQKTMTTARGRSLEMQDEIARMVLAFVGDDTSVYQFTPEEEAEQYEADAAEGLGPRRFVCVPWTARRAYDIDDDRRSNLRNRPACATSWAS